MDSREPTNRSENLLSSYANYARTRRTPAGLERSGIAFAPTILVIRTGEDVVQKMKMFVLNRRESVTIVSARGLVSSAILSVTLLAGVFGFKFQGIYDILSLTGKIMPLENNVDPNAPSLMGTIKVYLARIGGRIGGHVVSGEAVRLIALSEVRVVLGSYVFLRPANVVAPPQSQSV